ncbi:MAG: hypothetical protein R8G66_16335 [Cytophagales bacterium]|nr:hypothetical protein [Cytophagales bacterium]
MKDHLSEVMFIVILLILIPDRLIAQNPPPETLHFDRMAQYLTKGTGKWKADNPNYQPNNPRSAKAFGLCFERPMRNYMSLTIVSYQKDTVLINSEGFFSWHPGKQQYVHVNGNRGSGFAEGITTFPNDSTFISTMTIFRRNGSSYDHKDENFIVNEDVHRNTSYKKVAGDWVAEGEWVWSRVPEN